MNTIKHILAAAIAFLPITHANALDLQAGGEPKPRVTHIQLGIISPEPGNCPVNVSIKAWVRSNKPSTFPILVVVDNGTVLGPYMVETTTGANGVTMGTWDDTVLVGSSLTQSYRIVTPNSTVASNWVPMTVTCN